MEPKEAYRVLEDIVTQGFITSKIVIGDKVIALKTITDTEYKYLNLCLSDNRSEREKLVYRLIFSTFMIDGYNLLRDREERIKQAQGLYNALPVSLFNKISKEVEYLYSRFLEASQYFEGFCYTDKSRYLWKSLKYPGSKIGDRLSLNGSEFLGLNNIQHNWFFVNNNLDAEEEYEKQFNLSVMVASSFNPKGANTLSRNFEVKREELKEVRKSIAKYGYDKIRYEKERSIEEWSKPIKSREDIVRELEKQISGVKDKHDLFIENWIKNQQKIAEDSRKKMEAKQELHRKKQDELESVDREPSRLVTPEELRNMKNKDNKGISRTADYDSYQKKQKFIKKVSSVILKSDG